MNMNAMAIAYSDLDYRRAEAARIGRDGLMGFVLDAVHEVEWPNKDKCFGLNSEEQFPSELLMVLEVFCYARGLYESSKIEHFISKSPELSVLLGNQIPDSQCLKKFRRYHRDPIKKCLLKIFDLALRVRFGQADTDEAPIDYCVVQAIDQWFDPICGPHPSAEAEERIDKAIFWDGVLGSC